MARRKQTPTFVLCINNEGCEAALELRKLYQVMPPETNDPAEWLRVVDESGEDYLYSGERFITLPIPRPVQELLVELSD
jgi:hypothetical protein